MPDRRKPTPTRLPRAARLRAIREHLSESSSISISQMARHLRVSEMTIRRDLEMMENQSELRRTHGGAVIAERTVFEFTYQERHRARHAEKKAIAAAAADLVKPGQRIILDTGTTTLHLAASLKQREGLTVITPSLAVASELQFSAGITVVLLGGVIHRGSPDLTGPLTEHSLDLFSADWVFQGAEAVGSDGSTYNTDLQLAQVDRKMRRNAQKAVLLVDGTKFGGTALVCNGRLSDFDIVITDGKAPRRFVTLARKTAERVIIA